MPKTPEIEDPVFVSFLMERSDVERIEALAGPKQRSRWLREAVQMRLDAETNNPRASRRVIIVGDD